MFTDRPPQGKDRTGFWESDRINTLNLPQDAGLLPEIAMSIEAAMQTGETRGVRVACARFLSEASRIYQVPECGVRVLAARPLKGREWTYELFGDYDPKTMLMRLWMRTAKKKEVTSFGTFLSTLCHEFCHHLDYHLFVDPEKVIFQIVSHGRCGRIGARMSWSLPLMAISARRK